MNRERSGFHRDRLDIIAAVLEEAIYEVRKTHIMYKCNLSFKQLEIYLRFLVEKGLLKPLLAQKNPKGYMFQTTNKGQVFLRSYQNLKSFLSA